MARSRYTINDLMKDQYQNAGINKDMVAVKKTLGVGTPDARNVLYGIQAFTQFNNETITWAVLPKSPWKQSGFRMRTGAGFTPGTGTSVADGGSFGATATSELRKVEVSWKTTRVKFGVDMQFALNAGNDDDYSYEEEIKHKALDHMKDINKQLNANGESAVVATNIESIDRIISNVNEATAYANYQTVYDIDRLGVNGDDADASVLDGAGAVLTTRAVRDLIDDVRAKSGKRLNVFITRSDTAAELSELFDTQMRYDLKREDFTVNGVSTTGQDFLQRVGAIDGIPVLVDPDVINGATANALGNIYGLNTEHISFATLLATQFYESNEEGMLERDELQRVGAYVTVGNLWCNMFSAHGKLKNYIANP